mmetsp:Transcript_11757/g.21395  ORF Transcript_11757/g.21395 Transcript_11757/m.21395 type:complete len:251 (-) Transcript_11757:202-954(-)
MAAAWELSSCASAPPVGNALDVAELVAGPVRSDNLSSRRFSWHHLWKRIRTSNKHFSALSRTSCLSGSKSRANASPSLWSCSISNHVFSSISRELLAGRTGPLELEAGDPRILYSNSRAVHCLTWTHTSTALANQVGGLRSSTITGSKRLRTSPLRTATSSSADAVIMVCHMSSSSSAAPCASWSARSCWPTRDNTMHMFTRMAANASLPAGGAGIWDLVYASASKKARLSTMHACRGSPHIIFMCAMFA